MQVAEFWRAFEKAWWDIEREDRYLEWENAIADVHAKQNEMETVFANDLDSVFNAEAPDYSNLTYYQYLQTPHWQKLRRICLERTYYACQRCGSVSKLQVHHRNYERLGQERMIDLEVLCDACHREEHDLPPLEQEPRP